jgi:predicted glycoside hydrolase/deacetylase ChbG (UPF0249 family)
MKGEGEMPKFLIVNADDLGASSGVNRGVLDAHRDGIVTSASLTVAGRAARDAVAMARDHPDLALGLHWDVCGEDEREFDLENLAAVADEIERQLETFERLVGRLPTHVDSHRHLHRSPGVAPLLRERLEPLDIPLRDDGRVKPVTGFYAQWEWMVTDLHHVSVEFLRQLLLEEVGEGWTELSCHPGYPSPDFHSVYLEEREVEVRTLTDHRVRDEIDRLAIRLRSYADYGSSVVQPQRVSNPCLHPERGMGPPPECV